MTSDFSAATAVLLPGSGSDGDFVRRAYAPLTALCARVLAVDARPPSVEAAYRSALDDAAALGPVVVCGVSLGSVIGSRWAAERCGAGVAGLVLALPPWTGPTAPDTPAALAARVTADTVDAVGPVEATARMRSSSPGWLARELSRSWAAHGAFLSPALREAAACPGPTGVELARVHTPTVVIGARGDAVHPAAVADEWASAIPAATALTVELAELGGDPAVLGRVAAKALGWAARP
ncbi:alpha/beta hydrolase [Tsukamurella sp. 8F]|uniref:alpha/beta fold hydrolase n=1 Tax=unclassified Tsukamurella TaxID=2633480 RepID=UPI0023BA33C1|nr:MULTISPECIES: alpha/beta hydrolase [unclassified Tsukamurella]MDF0531305.1 alpha/beta hydrolase [Tsukamurella sp. 8J]MDF0585254.1 alpha/beta hydrolase [Tsukamurella sp. 8F]